MNRNKAEYRRERGQPSYTAMSRAEYITRAHELANRGDAIAKKLTSADVRAIRENRNGKTDKQQAEIYGVHFNTIYKIRHRMIWGCVR